MRLYADSMLWVYFFEHHPVFSAPTRAFFSRSLANNHQFLASELILAELLVIPKRKKDLFTAVRYRRFFRSASVTNIPFTIQTTESFSELRAFARVKPADALHPALAASAGADYFVTNDTKLHALSLPGIGRICAPDDVP